VTLMALHDLLAAIEADATADIERLRAGRHREAGAILADAERQAAELERSAVSAAEQTEREAGERRLTAALEAIAGRLRDAHEDAYQQICRDARARLRMVRERGDYPAIVARLLEEARSVLPSGVVVRVDPADELLIRRLLRGENRLRVAATLRCAGGVVVTDEAGASVRNTAEERFTAAEPDLRVLVGRLLGADGDGAPLAGAASRWAPA
jgi:V/A-type H+/Na+-transporting ATPase subunit E